MDKVQARPDAHRRPRRNHRQVNSDGHGWPVEALVSAAQRPLQEIAVLAGFSSRAGHRWSHWETFSDEYADLLACRVGLHPSQVWPDWFAAAPDIDLDEDLDEDDVAHPVRLTSVLSRLAVAS